MNDVPPQCHQDLEAIRAGAGSGLVRERFVEVVVAAERPEWLGLHTIGHRRAAFVRNHDRSTGHWLVPWTLRPVPT